MCSRYFAFSVRFVDHARRACHFTRWTRERAILAILLLNIGEVVPVERLIDGLWGEARPSVRSTWFTSTCRGCERPWSRSHRSRCVRRGTSSTWLARRWMSREFGRLTGAARAAAGAERHAEALRSYDQALALWRGDALADIALEGHVQIAAARLDQERRLVGEERIEAHSRWASICS